MSADIIIVNGSVFYRDTFIDSGAIAIKDGRIVFIGDEESALKFKGPDTKLINANGCSVLPGFIDTHIHLVSFAKSFKWLDLRDVSSIQALKEVVKNEASRAREGEWILGRGWDQEKFAEKRYPNRYDLDEASPKNPVFLLRICGHVAVANSCALKIANIDKDTQEPPGGAIERDGLGHPTGILKESAVELVKSVIPEPSEGEYVELLEKAIDELLRNGITTVHYVSAEPKDVEILRKLESIGKLKVRVRLYYDCEYLDDLISSGVTKGHGGEFLRVNGIKVFVDGSLGARTAALREPYSDDQGNYGKLRLSLSELREIVCKSHLNGLQLAVHAIGDKALEEVLEAIRTLPNYEHNVLRHRVEHASLCPPDLLRGIKELNLVVSIQPLFIVYDFWILERLGEERVKWVYPFRSFLRNGIIVGGSSDAPVTEVSPIKGIYALVTRGVYEGLLISRYTGEERLDIVDAINVYTKYAAYLGFDENELGSLEVGKKADVVILSHNLKNVAPDELSNVKVVLTLVNGEVVYGLAREET